MGYKEILIIFDGKMLHFSILIWCIWEILFYFEVFKFHNTTKIKQCIFIEI